MQDDDIQELVHSTLPDSLGRAFAQMRKNGDTGTLELQGKVDSTGYHDY